jgi:hypothetical protein
MSSYALAWLVTSYSCYPAILNQSVNTPQMEIRYTWHKLVSSASFWSCVTMSSYAVAWLVTSYSYYLCWMLNQSVSIPHMEIIYTWHKLVSSASFWSCVTMCSYAVALFVTSHSCYLYLTSSCWINPWTHLTWKLGILGTNWIIRGLLVLAKYSYVLVWIVQEHSYYPFLTTALVSSICEHIWHFN